MKLFNFDKPGKGVSKKQLEKRGVVRFFEIYVRAFWRFCTVNFWYCITSLPLVTNGMAQAGLAYVARNTAMETPTFGTSDFFDIMKKNWKTSLVTGIINLLITGLLIFDWYFFYNQAEGEYNTLNILCMAGIMFLYVLFTLMKYYIPLLTVTFRPKLRKLYKNSLVLAVAGIRRNIIIFLILGIIYAAAAGLLWITKINLALVFIYGLVFLFVFPAFRSYLIQYNAFQVVKKIMIDPYYEQHPDEDIEMRRSLGILKDDDEEEQDESVFIDTVEEEK